VFVLASAMSYYLVERPFLRLKRRTAPTPRTLQ
jgi:peptidoglycan/LPS O-acetylase OafA/YrhL